MPNEPIVFTIFLVFTGAAIFATAALYTRQSLLVGYILLGGVLGPWGLKLVPDLTIAHHIGNVGIIFLLFLLGLYLKPQNLVGVSHKIIWVALASSLILALIGYGVSRLLGFDSMNACVIGASMMFSSTIMGLKLLPTTVLHHKHVGSVMISILLIQDFLAVLVLLLMRGISDLNGVGYHFLFVIAGLPMLIGFAFLMEKFVLVKLLGRFDKIREYVFLLSIGWCLGLAQLAELLGLPAEIGAFFAGVALAAHPVSVFIAESLKPLRDFFLVMFFFSLGASFDFHFINSVLFPAFVLTLASLLLKPLLFRILLRKVGESHSVAWEAGVRLGQGSEFSLLVASFGVFTSMISQGAAHLIQATTLFTFIASSYIVVLRYPTPMAFSDKMRKD